MKKILCLSLALLVGPKAFAQDSWSDSIPRIIKISQNSCPIKVRDKNGQWAIFDTPIPAGRNVLASLNPRRPDLVFFRLQQDSAFLFVAPRTCFEGEENWQTQQLIEKKDPSILAQRRRYMGGSFDAIYTGARLTRAGQQDISLRRRIYGFCPTYGVENKTSSSWYRGWSGCLGMGPSRIKPSEGTSSYSLYEGGFAFYGTGRFTTYYDFIGLPYGMGVEAFLGFLAGGHEVPQVNYKYSPSFTLHYGLAAGWRFYVDRFIITPKVVFNKFLPKYTGFEIQASYIF